MSATDRHGFIAKTAAQLDLEDQAAEIRERMGKIHRTSSPEYQALRMKLDLVYEQRGFSNDKVFNGTTWSQKPGVK